MAQGQSTADDSGEWDTELTIRVSGATFPDDEQDRETILQDLGRQVGRILEENHGIHADHVGGNIGPEYTQIGDDCPVCGHSRVELRDFTFTDNGATASAFCPECHWSGTAIYRLIDYESRRNDDDWRSAVVSGKSSAHRFSY